jgi:hypothetical protein
MPTKIVANVGHRISDGINPSIHGFMSAKYSVQLGTMSSEATMAYFLEICPYLTRVNFISIN